MFGCVMSSKEYHLENNNLFVDDSLKVYGIQIPEKHSNNFKNYTDSFSIIEVIPKSIVMIIDEKEVRKLFSNRMTNFRKILYEGNILWVCSDNLFIFRDKKMPSEIISLNKRIQKNSKI